MKILVTGGAGYIATHTDVELLNAGYNVIAVDNLSNSCREAIRRVERLAGKPITFYEADLLDEKKLDEIFDKEKPDAVIHFAGLKAVGESCKIPLAYFQNNITGTLHLLKCMEKHGVKRLVFSSSATVYGQPDTVPITEDAPLFALNPYGRTKLVIEDMLRDLYAADSSWNIALLRYFNPIGAHESGEIGEEPNGIPNNLVPYVAKVAVGKLDHITVFGNDYDTPDGTGIRDYIHVVDLALGHLKAIEKLNQNPGIVTYNLGTGIGYSVLDVIKSYEKACGKRLPFEFGTRRPGDAPVCYADAGKALTELSWKAVRGLDKMCEDSYRWQSKNPNGYEEEESKIDAAQTPDFVISHMPVAKSEHPWYQSAVFYHIYPLGMCGAPKQNTGGESAGRMQELIDFIPHLKRLFVGGVYIGPLFESVGHGYETTDYYKVDRRLGDNESFKTFVEKCHESGIKVVVDGVFNHTGREFFAFKDIKEKKQGSGYLNWYSNVNFSGNNEFNDGFSYEAWRGYNILPKLNLKNPSVKEYLKDAIRFWVSEFDIDGIRLDTADVLDFDFMKELRVLSREIKSEFWLMGEVIHGDYSRWVNADMLHSVTNYELHKGLYSGHNDLNYFEIAHTVRRLFGGGGIVKDALLYTFAENQDVDRLASKLKNKNHIWPVYVLTFTLPGIPSIYYGGEFALLGKHENGSDDGIRPRLMLSDYCLKGMESDVTASAKEVYKEEYAKLLSDLEWLSLVRRRFLPLAIGEYQELLLSNRQYAFARIHEKEAVIIAVNCDSAAVELSIKLPFGKWVTDLKTGEKLSAAGEFLKAGVEGCGAKLFYVGY